MEIAKVNLNYLSDEFFAEHNKEKRDWYTKFTNKYSTELEHWLEWRSYARENNIYITFFDWYLLHCQKTGINIGEDSPLQINQTPKITQEYKDLLTNEKTISIHPPKTVIKIQDKYIARPLTVIENKDKIEDICKDIVYQNNYSNEILCTISQQLNRIEGFIGIRGICLY